MLLGDGEAAQGAAAAAAAGAADQSAGAAAAAPEEVKAPAIAERKLDGKTEVVEVRAS